MQLNQNSAYFNNIAIWHMVFLLALYILPDAFLIDYSVHENAFDIGYYIRLGLSVLYFVASKSNQTGTQFEKNIDAAFHFSLLLFCLWLALMSFTVINAPLSRSVGFVLIIGGLSGLSLAIEITSVIHQKVEKVPAVLLAIVSGFKILVCSIFCLAAFFLFTGEWRWELNP